MGRREGNLPNGASGERHHQGAAADDEQPYEKVQIKVLFPKVGEFKNEVVLERWMEWRRVHPEEEALQAGKSTDGKAQTPANGAAAAK